ncbi:hypothetical protein ACFQHO_09670 [Actinomadura yumaensis]|uniref:hypothetical protein n=1 Tax=Actinomadura yumaensis TaxID=111807 RepID=UPI00360D976C
MADDRNHQTGPALAGCLHPFQVTSALWDKSPEAVFLHDLPAHRGEDVTTEVLEGPHSLAFDQAENKMYAAMAVLEWCAGRLRSDGSSGTA